MALTAGAITPSSPTIDNGQSITLTANPSGGTGTYAAFQWYTASGCSNGPISGATSSTYVASPTTTTTYYYKVTDTSTATACTSTGDTVTVNPAPSAGPISPSSPSIDNGQSILLTAPAPTGGTGPFTYQWYLAPSPGTCTTSDTLISGATSSTYTVNTPTAYDPYYACYIVTDTGVTSGSSPTVTAGSSTDLVTIDSPLSAPTISAGTSAFDSGGSSVLSVLGAFSGGASTYTCQWLSEAPGAGFYSNLGSSFSCTTGSVTPSNTGALSTTGTYHYELQVTDSANAPVTVTSSPITVTVNAAPSGVTMGSFLFNPVAGSGSDSVSVSWTGGTGPFTVTVYQGTSSTSCSSADTPAVGQSTSVSSSPNSVTFTAPASAGTFYYCAVVQDADSNSAASSTNGDPLTVTTGPSSVSIGAFGISPVDVSTSDSVPVSWTGGTGPFTVTLYYSTSPTSCSSLSTQAASPSTGVSGSPVTIDFTTPSSANTYYYCAVVTDTNSNTAASDTSGTPLVVDPALSPGTTSPSSPSIDDGQSVTLTANPTGGSGSNTYQWFTTNDCSTTSVSSASSSATFSPSPTVSTTYYVKVTDSSGNSVCSAGDTVTVDPALSPGSITPSSPTIDSGQSIQLSASWTSGTSTYTVTWHSGTSATCSSDTTVVTTDSALAASPDSILVSPSTSTYYCAVIADSGNGSPPQSVTDAAVQVTVNGILVAPTISASPTTTDSGLSVTLSTTSSFSGGTFTYSCQWLAEPPGSGTFGDLLSSFACSPGDTPTTPTGDLVTTGIWHFELQVIDSAYVPSTATSAAVAVTVNSDIVAPSISVSPSTIDSGQSATLSTTSSFSSGTPSYTCQWLVITPGQEFYADLGSSFSCTPGDLPTASTGTLSTVGTYYFELQVSDVSGGSNRGGPVTVVVNSAPSAPTVGVAPSTIDSGQGTTLAVSSGFSGGTSPYTCQWLEEAPGANTYSTLGSSFSCTAGTTSYTQPTGALSSAGTWHFELQVTDSAPTPVVVASSPVTVTVNAALTAPTISLSPSTADIGVPVAFSTTVSFSGGTATYVCQWLQESPGASSYSNLGSSFSCSVGDTPSYSADLFSTGTWNFELQVTDSSGTPSVATSSAVSLTVNPDITAPTISVSASTIDSGQSATLSTTSSFSSGTPSYTCQWLVITPGQEFYADLGSSFSCSAGDLPTASTGTLSTTGTWYFELQVSDSGGGSNRGGPVSVTVNSQFTGTTVTITPSATIDYGQSVTLTASWTAAGTGPYTVQLETAYYTSCAAATDSGSPTAGISGTSTTFTVSPPAGTVVNYCAVVSDSSSAGSEGIQTTSAAIITTNAALSGVALGTFNTNPIDVGQADGVAVSWSGGTSTYSVTLYYTTSPTTCSSSGTPAASQTGVTGTSVPLTFTAPSSAGTYLFCAVVTDLTGASSPSSGSYSLTVDPAITISTQLVSPVTIDVGQTYTYAVAASGGTGVYSYAWSLPSDVTGTCATSSATCVVTGVTAGAQTVTVTVTDTGSGSDASASTITVEPQLSVTGLTTPVTIDAGQTYTWYISVSGGTGSYTYSWSYSNGGAVTEVSATCGVYYLRECIVTSNTPGSYTISVTIGDALSAGTGTLTASASLTVNSALTQPPAPSPSAPSIDQGQWLNITGTIPSTGTGPYQWQWLVSTDGGATYVDATQCYAGQGSANSGSGATAGSTVACDIPPGTLTPGVSYSFELQVTDSAGVPETVASPSTGVTMNTDLVAPAVTPSPSVVDRGSASSLTSSAVTTGTSPYTYVWFVESPGGSTYTVITGATSSSYDFVTSVSTSTGTWSFILEVTDHAGASVNSTAASVTVNLPLSAGPLSPSSPSISSGKDVTFTIHPKGGTGPYAYHWHLPPGVTIVSGCTLTSDTCTVTSTAPGTYTVSVTVGDSAGSSSTSSASLTIASPLSVAVSPKSLSIDSGQSITFAASPTGGVGPYSYQWFTGPGCSTPISGATGPSLTVSPSSTTSYSVLVTDSDGSTSCAGTGTVTVNGPLVAGPITPPSPTIGNSVTLTSHPSGGTAPYSYQWYTGVGCTDPVPGATSATYTASPTTTTEYYYKVTDSAHSPESACSVGDTVTVASTPGVSITPTSGPPGTLIFISGTGFTPGGNYNYCFEPGANLSSMTPCPPTYQFTSTSSGAVPPLTVLTAFGQNGLVVVSGANTGEVVAYAPFTVTTPPAGSPTISITPASGLTGTPVTLNGTGFSPGVTVTIVMSRGTVATATAGPDGSFSVTFDVPSSPPGPETVTASGSDIATSPVDVATTVFTVTNVGDYQSDVFPVAGTNGTASVNDIATTDVFVSIPGLGTASDATLRIELANLTLPSYGVAQEAFTGATRYFDVFVVGEGAIPSGLVAHVCITNTIVGAGTGMQYWDGSAWVNPSDITISGSTICGSVPMTGLGGTNFAVGDTQNGTTTTHAGIVGQTSRVWFFVLPLLVGSLVFFFLWFFLLAGKRRKKDEEEEPRKLSMG